MAGEKITAKLTNAPGHNAPIGGLKVVAENGWFAARPSGTENLYKNRMKLPMSRGRSGSGCPLAAQPGMHCDAVSLVRRARRSRTR
jgi:hypothetical protein